MHYEKFNLSELFQSIIQEHMPEHKDNNIEISVAPDIWVTADISLINVVIRNLIDNT